MKSTNLRASRARDLRIAVLHVAWLFPMLWCLAWGVMAVTP